MSEEQQDEIVLETRDIRDADGNVVVTVQLPVGTSEAQWQHVLSAYIIGPVEE